MGTIFDPLVRFREEDSDTRALETSFGIGLYIARQIVEAHHGEIEVESSAMHGTTFTVALPSGMPLFG